MKSALLASTILFVSFASYAFEPKCSITYSKSESPSTYVYQTVCHYGTDGSLVQEMETAWVSFPSDTLALLNACEAQCLALNSAHPNGF